VNGPSPAYAIAHGATLSESLALNLASHGPPKREPPWLLDEPPDEDDLDAVTVLAWRSRRHGLGACAGEDATCATCGRPGPGIAGMAVMVEGF